MNNTNFNTVHSDFKWNGISLGKEKLILLAHDLIKKGNDFEINTGKFLLEWFDSNSFITANSSGTTGISKQIAINKQAMVSSALATAEFFNLKPKNRVLHCMSTSYIAGKMMLVRCIILGFEMDYVTPNSSPLKGNSINYDFVAMVPLQVQNSISELFNVKKLIIGGAKISETLRNQLLELPTQIFETYGMTETITHIAAKKIQQEAYTTLPNIKITTNESGCLLIDAPRISSTVIVTNDAVSLLSETQFILLGRIDNMVNSGGIKLFPEQIEAKLADQLMSRFFVIGIPDALLGEKLILVIEGNNQDIDKNLFNNLHPFEKPKEIRFVAKFIETETGKIKRNLTILQK